MEREPEASFADLPPDVDADAPLAVARLVEEQAEVLEELHGALSRAAGRMAGWREELRHVHRQPRNERQRSTVEIADLLTADGLEAQDVDDRLGCNDLPHTRRALRMLERYGVLEEVEVDAVARWRFTPRYRLDPIVRALASVPSGRWTTAEDVAIAVRGRLDFAPAASAVLRTSPVAPHWWRVAEAPRSLVSWSETRSRDEAERRLAAEGCLGADGTLERAAKVDWSSLVAPSSGDADADIPTALHEGR